MTELSRFFCSAVCDRIRSRGISFRRSCFWSVILLLQPAQAGYQGGEGTQRPGSVRPGRVEVILPDHASRPGPLRPTMEEEATEPVVADVPRPGAVRPDAPASPSDLATEPTVPELPSEQLAVEPATLVSDDISIPEVINRPLGTEEGPFVQVKSFRLRGIEDLPRHDVAVVDIENLLSGILAKQPARGYSIGELQEIADQVTQYYRDKDLILAAATIPVQTVVEGVVDIELYVGVLGRILAEGNEEYSVDVLRKPFAGLIGQPVTKAEIEGALLTLTEFPGLSVYGVFQPGIRVGEADIVLSVQEEKSFDLAARIDNHGLREIGRNRVRFTGSFNNPSRGADRLQFSVQQSYNPRLNFYWSGEYQRFFGRSFLGGMNYSQNRFAVDSQLANDLDLNSLSRSASIYLEKSFLRSRRLNLSSQISLHKKHSQTFLEGTLQNRTNLTTLEWLVNFDSVDNFHPLRFLYQMITDIGPGFGGGLNFADVRYTRGFNNFLGAMGSGENSPGRIGPGRLLPNNNFASGQFDKLFGSFSRLQLLSRHQSMLMRLEFQWTNDALTPLEQYSVGGPNNVRAFPDAQGLFDRAWYGSVDYVFNAPFIADAEAFGNRTWGELIQFSLFYDFASAQLNHPRMTNTGAFFVEEKGKWVSYRGYGMSLRFTLPGMIDSRIVWSRTAGDNLHTPADNGHTGQLWGDFTFSW